MIFNKPKNALEGFSQSLFMQMQKERGSELEPSLTCPRCKKSLSPDELLNRLQVCPYCRHHFKMNARQRIHLIADEGSFVEHDADLEPKNILGFPGYDKKLKAAELQSSEKDSVICGECTIGKHPTALFIMEPNFMMGSMGRVAGEKITRTFERAIQKKLPVIGFALSGGARMQEGMISLMQMAKTSGAIKKHSDAGLLYVCVLTDPTTGGVTASFAMEADIIIAEPGALIGFAGPRVIEQTIRKSLPAGFQRSEFQLEHGFVDNIVNRKNQRKYLLQLLHFHRNANAEGGRA